MLAEATSIGSFEICGRVACAALTVPAISS
jgi:hypothetical protein